VLSAVAAGPAFVLLTSWIVEKITGNRLVSDPVKQKLGRISGILLIGYVMLKSIDTLIWLNSTSRQSGFLPWEYYAWKPFGTWVLLAEIVLFGLVPALLLVSARTRTRSAVLIGSAVLVCCGVVLNRFVLTIQTLALPTLPFDEFMNYTPSWQEVAAFLFVVAYAVIVYSFSYRYLPLFPQEKELAGGDK
jgi:molybdopterin-containing oxidoreductase family membrane subunit